MKRHAIPTRLEEEFHQAIELEGREREVFLERLENQDPALATALRRLIALDERELEELDRPLLEQLSFQERTQPPSPLPLRVGPYRIEGLLGKGGMGMIYEASQENPHRTIALKLLRRDLLDPEAERRFHREAEILARLPHEGIAHIYQAGHGLVQWPGGETSEQPYLAMELIRGLPLVEYCRRNRLGLEERIRLLIRICSAVEQAHRKGIVHRDLKPQNILVNQEGVPKVLDFGVARLLEAERNQSFQTHTGQILGTLSYMSPEQVRGDSRSIGPPSDVYALGVIGFQCLAGVFPLDVHGCSIAQAARIIQEEQPTRLGEHDSSLRGDLETIFETALEKDPQRRYPSAGEMGADLQRFLQNEPIHARPPSRLYRIQKFTRRHRGLVYGTLTTFLVLILGVIGTTTFALRSRKSEAEAKSALARARREADKTEQIRRFLAGMLTASDPNLRRGKPLTVVELVDAAAREMDRNPPKDPLVEASLRGTLGETYRNLSQYPRSARQLKKALSLYESHLDPGDPRTAELRLKYARVLVETQKLEDAEKQLRLCAAAYHSLGDRGKEGLTQVLLFRSQLLTERRRFEEAAQLAKNALDLARKIPGQPLLLADCLSQVAFIRVWQGKYQGTEDLYRKAYDLRAKTGRHLSLALQTLVNIASLYMTQGKDQAAEHLYTKVLEKTRRELGQEHQMVSPILFRRGVLRKNHGRDREAIEDLKECIRVEAKVRGARSDLVATAQLLLGEIYARKKKVVEARRSFEAARTILERSQGGDRKRLLQRIERHLAALDGKTRGDR